MENLKESVKRHGLRYRLIKRNDRLAVFGVSGTHTDRILHYEVVHIRIRDDQYGYRESIPSDEEFGKTKPDQHFHNMDKALAYFDEWTMKLIQGVEENAEKVVSYHQRENPPILHKSVRNTTNL